MADQEEVQLGGLLYRDSMMKGIVPGDCCEYVRNPGREQAKENCSMLTT
jgi:hypothetical protein